MIRPWKRSFAALVLAVAAFVSSPVLRGQAGGADRSALRAERAYAEAMRQGPAALRGFLVQFPKGADLHVHLSGAVYAETFLRDAAEDGVCVDPSALRFVEPPCTSPLVPAQELAGNLDAREQSLYDKLIDAFSMRGFVPSDGWNGHDQFFATFGRFGDLKNHAGEWVDEVASRAAAQNQQYLELMMTPPFGHASQLAHNLGWSPALGAADPKAFAALRRQLLDHGLRDEVAADRAAARDAESQRNQIEQCATAHPAAACQVEVRFLYQVLRANAPETVFAQTLLGFETVAASQRAHDKLWVGINFVQPEDGFVAMRDYTLQMKMVGYLHTVYPGVHIALHAGELTLGMVPPEGLRFHIRQAVELAHAERIGHGVDAMDENDAAGLLREMATKHVMVEINLSSNAEILGVTGAAHPFPLYRAAHVPVALSTDDEGVSRIDLTHEYVRAAIDYHLGYADLKQLARTGMEHSFLPGASVWAKPDDFSVPVAACKNQPLGAASASPACKAFLQASEKAAAQWELERRFHAFEAGFR